MRIYFDVGFGFLWATGNFVSSLWSTFFTEKDRIGPRLVLNIMALSIAAFNCNFLQVYRLQNPRMFNIILCTSYDCFVLFKQPENFSEN